MNDKLDLMDDPLLRDLPVVDGRKRLGPCLLLRKIGRGGAGNVYLAHHENLGIEVAVKCLKRSVVEEDERVVARFKNEARVAATLNHPNLIRVYDVGEDHGLHFMIMEFAAGETLKARVKRLGPLSVAEAVRLVTSAAHGLEVAHERGIVHRDIKPDNILVANDGEVKVLDLGIAKILEGDDTRTLTRLLVGTPQYMSPEQWDDSRSVTQATDVYGLGCTLFYLLAGRAPFRSGSPMEVMKRVCLKPFPDITTVRNDIPFPLLALLNDSVARNPLERPHDAREFARALDEFLASPAARGAREAPILTSDSGPDSEEFTPQGQSDSSFSYEMAYAQVPSPQNENSSALRVINSRRKIREKPASGSPNAKLISTLALAFVAALGLGLWIASPRTPDEPRAEDRRPESSASIPAAQVLRSVKIGGKTHEGGSTLTVSQPDIFLELTTDPRVTADDLTITLGSTTVPVRSRSAGPYASFDLPPGAPQTLRIARGADVLHTSRLMMDRDAPTITLRDISTGALLDFRTPHNGKPGAHVELCIEDGSPIQWDDQQVKTENFVEQKSPPPTTNRLTRIYALPASGTATMWITPKDGLKNTGATRVIHFTIEGALAVTALRLDDRPVEAGASAPTFVRRSASTLNLTLNRAVNELRVVVASDFDREPNVRRIPVGNGLSAEIPLEWNVAMNACENRTVTLFDGSSNREIGRLNVTVDRVTPRIEFPAENGGVARVSGDGSLTVRILDIGGIDKSSLEIHGGRQISVSENKDGLVLNVGPSSTPGNVTIVVRDLAGNEAKDSVRTARK